MKRPISASIFLLCLPLPAEAHAPIEGIGSFYNGVLHPFLVPAHLLVLIGLGLLLGRHAVHPGRWGWLAFVAAFWTALAVGPQFGATVPEALLLALALIASLAVVLDRPLDLFLVGGLAAASGIAVGLDSRPDALAGREFWLTLGGTAVGGVLLLSYIGGLAARPVRLWHRIGVRVSGSWTAACAAIVLALFLSGENLGG